MKTNMLSIILLSTILFSLTCSIAEENKTKKDEVRLWDKKLYALIGSAASLSSAIAFYNGPEQFINRFAGSSFIGATTGLATYAFTMLLNHTYRSKKLYLEAKKLEQSLTIDEKIFDQNNSIEDICNILKSEYAGFPPIVTKYENKQYPLVAGHLKVTYKIETAIEILEMYHEALKLNNNLKNVIEPRIKYISEYLKKLKSLDAKIQNNAAFDKQKIKYLERKVEKLKMQKNNNLFDRPLLGFCNF